MAKTFVAFGKKIEFSEDEINFLDSIKLDISDTYLEAILDSYDLDLSEKDLSGAELHDLCLETIKQYVGQIAAGTDCLGPLINIL